MLRSIGPSSPSSSSSPTLPSGLWYSSPLPSSSPSPSLPCPSLLPSTRHASFHRTLVPFFLLLAYTAVGGSGIPLLFPHLPLPRPFLVPPSCPQPDMLRSIGPSSPSSSSSLTLPSGLWYSSPLPSSSPSPSLPCPSLLPSTRHASFHRTLVPFFLLLAYTAVGALVFLSSSLIFPFPVPSLSLPPALNQTCFVP